MSQRFSIDDRISSDFSGYGEDEKTMEDTKNAKKGWFISRTTLLALLVSAVVLLVLVGLAVYYGSAAGRKDCDECCQTLQTPSPIPTGSTEAPAMDIRLPRNNIPIHYDLKLKPDFYDENPVNFKFEGEVSISFRCNVSTPSVTLHSNALQIEDGSVVLTQQGQTDLRPSGMTEDKKLQFLTFTFGRSLTAGNEYVLRLKFKGPLLDDLDGLYWSSYVKGNVTKRIVTSQMEPTSARKVFPCFDEPGYKATFQVTIVRKMLWTSIHNTPLGESVPLGDGWIEDRFNRTPAQMSTYLLAFSVFDDFEYVENFTKSGKPFRVYARSDTISTAAFALEVGIKVQDFFEEFFNISYAFPKQDLMAIPDFEAGAMENWGLIMFRETAVLFNPNGSSLNDKIYVATVVTHELSHQWCGDLVTPKWWDDLWLNEGFASFFEYLGMDHLQPDWKIFELFLDLDLHGVLSVDSLSSSHAIYRPILTNKDISASFDDITYSKGASVIRMMRNVIGEAVFRDAMTNYLTRHRFSNTDHSDLWEAFDEVQHRYGQVNMNVSSWMNTWLEQTGYPVVTVRAVVGNGQLSQIQLSQRRFLIDRNASDVDGSSSTSWIVPFTYVLSSSSASNWTNPQIVWLRNSNADVSVADAAVSWNANASWIIGNVGQFGFYRVNYETENWNSLINQLNQDHSVIAEKKNRAQLMDDAFEIGRSGAIDQLIALRMMDYLDKETDYVPWMATSSNLRYISMMFDRSPEYGQLEEYILRKVKPLYGTLGWNVDPNDVTDTRLLRTEILRLSCFYGHRPCLEQASKLYSNWMSTSNSSSSSAVVAAAAAANSIPGDLKLNVYCTALKEGGREEWEFAYQQYEAARDADEKKKIIQTLGCTKNLWLLSRYVNYTWDRLRQQDIAYAYQSIAQNPAGRYLTWNFLREQWMQIKDRLANGMFLLGRMIKAVTEAFNTESELQQLQEFADKFRSEMGSAGRVLDQSLEKTKLNVRWMKENEEKISRWLQERNQAQRGN